MSFPVSPDDRPDPLENMPAMRARIPEHVSRGEVSTGVIVVTGGTEYVLDFVRNLPRPNMIVARVVLPHMVMPQFIDALAANVELFRQRYGELPGTPQSTQVSQSIQFGTGIGGANSTNPVTSSPPTGAETGSMDAWAGSTGVGPSPVQPASSAGSSASSESPSGASGSPPPAPTNPTNHLRRQNPQEVYDDLKLRDEILSGAYANAVMIGHGPYEFSFDFITNFYPQSAVSCRVYLASGHIHRLLESLRASWEQLRPRLAQGNQPPNQPPQPPNQPLNQPPS